MHNRIKSLFVAIGLIGLISSQTMAATTTRVTLPSGKQIFVSGMNLAWKSYAQDVINLDTAAFNTALKALHNVGGNTMRVWLSTNGAYDPVFSNGYVVGPNSKTIANIQSMLKIAKQDSMLLCLSLLSHNYMQAGQGDTAINRKMLTTDAGLSAFITKYVDSVVNAIGNDPNLLCWEVCNEPEGMVESIGWTNGRITQANVQKFTARIAAAIHKKVPGILVSTGAVTTAYTTNAPGCTNWYSDSALKAIDSDTSAYLDFYMAHYYGWNGTSYSPFTTACSNWKLTKPLVIGEFPAASWSPTISSKNYDAASIDTLFTHLYNTGYAGGISWCYYGDQTDTWLGSFSTCSAAIAKIKDSSGVSFSGVSDNKFYVVVSAGNGGSVITSKSGRVESGALDTIIAVADEGYTFSGWSGDTTSTSDTLIVKVTKDISLTASFNPGAGTNLVTNGTFADSGTGWTFYIATGNTASVSYSGGYAAFTVSSVDTFNYHVQFSQGSIELNSGVTYVVSFDGWASAARTIHVDLSTASTWHWQGGGSVSLTTTKTTNTLEITPDSSTTAGILQFNLGKYTGTVYIDNVTIVKKTSNAILSSSSDIKSAKTVMRHIGSKIFWTMPQALATDGVVRILSASGRELSSVKLTAGATSCVFSVPETLSGVVFMSLESGKMHEVKSMLITR
jgi:uncharacterized repeat protein (TIGR02543 family)